jgi:hypothetical protein
MSHRGTSGNRCAALLLSALLAACGSSSDPEPGAPTATEPVAPGSGAASASTAPSPAVKTTAPPRPARIAARAEPSIEECIDRNIHDKAFDSLSPRDARRKLRRLQVKADCESRLAAR